MLRFLVVFLFGLFAVVYSMSDEQIMKTFGPQIEGLLTPCIKLACCNDPNVEKDAKKAVDCITDKDIVKKIMSKAEVYKKDKSKYCDKSGRPIDKTVKEAIEKEKAALLKEGNLQRYLGAVCVKPKIEALIKQYQKSCNL